MTKVEQVARAILVAQGSDIITSDDEWPTALAGWRSDPSIYEDVTEAMRLARAAIAAMDPPSEGMLAAFNSYAQCEGDDARGFTAMVAAALEEQA